MFDDDSEIIEGVTHAAGWVSGLTAAFTSAAAISDSAIGMVGAGVAAFAACVYYSHTMTRDYLISQMSEAKPVVEQTVEKKTAGFKLPSSVDEVMNYFKSAPAPAPGQ